MTSYVVYAEARTHLRVRSREYISRRRFDEAEAYATAYERASQELLRPLDYNSASDQLLLEKARIGISVKKK